MTATRIWTIGAVALIGAILALGWFLGVTPLLAQATAADTERAQVEAQIALQQAQLEKLRADFARLDELEAELAELQSSIPEYEGTELFAAYVSTVASAHGLSVTSFVASEMGYGGAASGDGAATGVAGAGGPALSTAAGTVYAIPITIGFEGTPEALTDAVRTLQNGPRLFLVQNVTFSRGTSGTPGGSVVGYIFILTDRQLAATPEDAQLQESQHTSNYHVPDLDEALPEWLGGEGTAPDEFLDGATPTPTPTPTGTPTP